MSILYGTFFYISVLELFYLSMKMVIIKEILTVCHIKYNKIIV